MKKYIGILLVLFILTINVTTVIGSDEGKKDVTTQSTEIDPGKKDITVLDTDTQNQTNQTNETVMSKETPPITIPIETPTSTPTEERTPGPVETTKAPGFEIVLAIVGISAIYVLGRFRRKRT